MKKVSTKPWLLILGAAVLAPATLLAQPGEKDKVKDEKKRTEQIIITRTGEKNEKVIVEVNGDKVTVNGKPIEEYKGDDVVVRKIKDAWAYSDQIGNTFTFNGNGNDNFRTFSMDSNRAMLGVTTEKSDDGVEVQNVTKESAAAKAGLKEGDVITKIDDKKIEDPDDLSKAIKAHKPGDKVNVTYKRGGKEQKMTAELGKWKGSTVLANGYKMDMGDLHLDQVMPRIQQSFPRGYNGQNWSYSSGQPKLGLSVQDSEDGKGVTILDVDSESNAEKAGLKENDLITEIDGKAVNSADEVAKIIKESKDKTSVKMKVMRGAKAQTVDVKIPRKLKTADL
jgi:serine protease Do